MNEIETTEINEYLNPEKALAYLAFADDIPHRTEGEAVVLELLPAQVQRVLDLGSGDGRLLALAISARPRAHGIALDFSPTMLEKARQRFADDERVAVIEHNLNNPLPDIGSFDVVLSSFAIHHVSDERKKSCIVKYSMCLNLAGSFAI